MPPVETLSGLPAPFWFIEFFKILGFVLHSIPMHLWLVGLPMGLFLLLIGGPNARYFAKRLLKSLPVITAIGINLGVVPFLFVQTAYYKAFYPASILTAVHWMSLILLVLIAYASLYFCSFSVGKNSVIKPLLFGLLATVCFVAAGLIFSSTWTLMSDPNAWPVIWSKTQIAGAVTGLGTYWNNPAVFVRFISIVGLGFITLSFWLVFDAVVLSPQKTALSFEEEYALLEAEEARKAQEAMNKSARQEIKGKNQKDNRGSAAQPVKKNASTVKTRQCTPESYRKWAVMFAQCTAWLGVIIAGSALWYYYFRILSPEQPDMAPFFDFPDKLLIYGMLGSLFLPILFLLAGKFGQIKYGLLTFLLTLSELIILGIFATTRQVIQNLQLLSYLDVSKLDNPSTVQWSPLLAFLGVFVVGALIIIWMIWQMASAAKKTNA